MGCVYGTQIGAGLPVGTNSETRQIQNINNDFLNHKYRNPSKDYDLSYCTDNGDKYMRGGYPYYRPYGWKRIGINVTGKYSDDFWLGKNGNRTQESLGEWAVTYHGTKRTAFNNICDKGYIVGPRATFGNGVYSAPRISDAERYAVTFTYKGDTYKGIFQNRVNPKGVNIVCEGKYWVCPDPNDIRPYGLCVKRC